MSTRVCLSRGSWTKLLCTRRRRARRVPGRSRGRLVPDEASSPSPREGAVPLPSRLGFPRRPSARPSARRTGGAPALLAPQRPAPALSLNPGAGPSTASSGANSKAHRAPQAGRTCPVHTRLRPRGLGRAEAGTAAGKAGTRGRRTRARSVAAAAPVPPRSRSHPIAVRPEAEPPTKGPPFSWPRRRTCSPASDPGRPPHLLRLRCFRLVSATWPSTQCQPRR